MHPMASEALSQGSWTAGSLLEPEVLLPGQEISETTKARKGEFGLLWAIFMDGIRTYCTEIVRHRTGSLPYREVERWIFRPDAEVVTSFGNLCELFEIDPRRLRRRLLHFRHHPNARLLDVFDAA